MVRDKVKHRRVSGQDNLRVQFAKTLRVLLSILTVFFSLALSFEIPRIYSKTLTAQIACVGATKLIELHKRWVRVGDRVLGSGRGG